MMKPNRFGAFADETDTAAEIKQVKVAAKAAEPKKKIVVKAAKAPVEEGEEFEKVENKNQAQRGGAPRGGRGGERRGGRGGERGGRGDRPRGDGESRGGDRRGRGRGDRPRTAMPVLGEDGQEIARPERAERRGGRGNKFEGKAREEAHPMDRQDGTGRGRRGDKKAGHGKANWGKDGEATEENKESKDDKPVRERKPREDREPREPKPEPIVEEEVGFTLDDYMVAKQAKSQGLYKAKDVRQHEKLDAKNIKDLEFNHDERSTTKLIKVVDTMATKPNAGSNLFGFQGAADDEPSRDSRGGRGGRGDRPVRQERPATQRGGRKGGKIVVDDNDFPAL